MPSTTEILNSLKSLRNDAADADQIMMRSATIPPDVVAFFDQLQERVDEWVVEAINSYQSSSFWSGAFEALNAVRVNDRIHLRFGLNNMLDALDALIEETPFSVFANIQDVITLTEKILSVPQREYAELLGVSPSTLRRWKSGRTTPSPNDDAKIRFVGKVAHQLSHSLKAPGIYRFFYTQHRRLGYRPVDLLDVPPKYVDILADAESLRSMSG